MCARSPNVLLRERHGQVAICWVIRGGVLRMKGGSGAGGSWRLKHSESQEWDLSCMGQAPCFLGSKILQNGWQRVFKIDLQSHSPVDRESRWTTGTKLGPPGVEGSQGAFAHQAVAFFLVANFLAEFFFQGL